MSDLADVLRKSARDALDIADGEYFDSTCFDKQAKAVIEYIARLIHDSEGDTDYILFALKQ